MSRPTNRLRELRKAANLTQLQLAKLAGTSQQQIQRVEAGVQAVRLELGVAIAGVLGVAVDELFPGTAKKVRALDRAAKKNDHDREEKLIAELNKTGVDAEPAIWTLKIGLEADLRLILPVSGAEKNRLWKLFQDPETYGPFVTFQSDADMVALNLRRLRYCHFLFDPPHVRISRKKRENSHSVAIHFSGSTTPFYLGVEPDSMELHDAIEKDRIGEAQLQNLFFQLDSCIDESEVLDIEDEDGETIFIYARKVLAVQAPLEYYSPALFEMLVSDYDEIGEESEEDDSSEPSST